MPAPLLFIGLPVLLALGLLGVAARWSRPDRWGPLERSLALTAAAGAVGLAALALRLPLDERVLWGRVEFSSSYAILGRTLAIGPADRVSLALMFGQGALLFLAAGLFGAGRFYLPAGLMMLGLLAGALFVRPFVFAAVFLELAAAGAVLMLVDETHRETRGAWRFLAFATLALPFILLSGWLLESSAANPGNVPLMFQAALILGMGFAILLAVVPFQSWVPMVAEKSPPLASAFIFVVLQQAVVCLILTFLGAYPWLGQNPIVNRTLTVVGGGMVAVGGLFAFGQQNFGRALGYAVLIDIGAVVLALGLGTNAAVAAALTTLVLRSLALAVWAVGCDQLRRAAGGDDFQSVRGLARRYPLSSAAVIFGLLSLVGFPLTAGFPGRWALIRLLAQTHPTGAILLLLGMASVSLVAVRGLAALLSPRGDEPNGFSPAAVEEKPGAMLAYGLGVILILVLGAFPQWVLPVVAQAAAVFNRAGP
jgi:NADH-quinone oxidoreductase subunit N